MKILIVDDNAGMRRLLRRAVAEAASDIWECSDGAQALAAYADWQPDVVLMDIRMPDVDGLAATRQIRQVYPSAKVVMVTDYDDYDLRIAAAKRAPAPTLSSKISPTWLAWFDRLLVKTNRPWRHSYWDGILGHSRRAPER